MRFLQSCRVHAGCCPNVNCYNKLRKGSVNNFQHAQLSAAFKEYKLLKTTLEYNRQEKIKNANFNLYDNFRLKLYKPEPGEIKNLIPFNDHLQNMLLNQERISVPGVYENSLVFSDS